MAVEGKNVVFCGNFEYDASERDINRLFERYGPVERIDMKTGFAFVYMKNKKDGDEAIYDLDRREWGYRRPRPLKVQWAKKVEEPKSNQQPSRTLFVVNFDVMRTSIRDVEDHFYRYGRLKRVDIKRNFAFVEFDSLDDAIEAQRRTHGTSFRGRTITVEFVQGRDGRGGDDFDGGRGGGGRGGGGGGGRGDYGGGRDADRGRSRSRSPAPRRRRSPSYDAADRRERGRDGASPPPRRADSPARREGRSPPPRRSRSRSVDRGRSADRGEREAGGRRSGSRSRSPR